MLVSPVETYKLNKDYIIPEPIIITDAWLLGFIEGDASFSTSGMVPRLKFENHIKEKILLDEIKLYLGNVGSFMTRTRKYRGLNENPTIILEINEINILKNVIISKYLNNNDYPFLTKKYFDFKTNLTQLLFNFKKKIHFIKNKPKRLYITCCMLSELQFHQSTSYLINSQLL